jgi:signal transduction histidine kinase
MAQILERAAEPPPQPEVEPELLAEAKRPTSPDVLRQLNRGVKVRDRVRRSSTFHVVKAGPGTLVAVRAAGPDRWEGFVVDVPALVSMIQSWVLTAQGLDQVAALAPAPGKGAHDSGVYHFRHVLASPLDEQTVWLRLSRLDDEDTSSVLYGLSALLSAAVVLGLYALYRMVAVQVRFAERRDNFVAAVTHELKTPITAIRMYGEMLRDDMVRDEDTRRDYYRMITAEGERLSRLINNVLEHARLRQGERPMRLMAGNVELLVREVVEVMRPHIEHEGFSIELEVDPALPRALYDDDALKQVLFNVIDNALKYGRYADGRKGGALCIRCKAVEGVVTICVRDFGPGVPAASLKTVFDPFYRAQDELTRSQPGTGIGLSLVRDLVGRMRGKVTGSNAAPGFEVEIALQS